MGTVKLATSHNDVVHLLTDVYPMAWRTPSVCGLYRPFPKQMHEGTMQEVTCQKCQNTMRYEALVREAGVNAS